MSYFTLTPDAEPKALVLLPEKVCNNKSLIFLKQKVLDVVNLDVEDVAFMPIPTPNKNKLTKAELAEFLPEVLEFCETNGVSIIAAGSADIYQAITGNKKFSLYIGKYLEGIKFEFKKFKISLDFTGIKVVPFLNPVILNQAPTRAGEVAKGLRVLYALVKGIEIQDENSEYLNLNTNKIITNWQEAFKVLKEEILPKPMITADIETTGLEWFKDELLTISFATSSKDAYCFAIHPQYTDKHNSDKMKEVLYKFLKTYNKKTKGKIIGHNWIAFDMPFIIHLLYRNKDFTVRHEPIVDEFNLIDTLPMAYILYNSTERVPIGLKELSFKYLGEYDADVNQKKLIDYPLEKVATYNNYDVIASWLVYEELKQQIEAEGFVELDKKFQRVATDLLKLKMSGLTIDKEKAQKLLPEIEEEIEKDKQEMLSNKWIKTVERILETKGKLTDGEFNPNSSLQKQALFFDLMGLPVIKKSKKSGNPSADKDSINEWLEREDVSEDKKEVIKLIVNYTLASKAVNSYVRTIAYEATEVAPNDFRIFANYNQNGTISGRLSSSGQINLQTIPSGSKYAKKIKSLFVAPAGKIMATADYSALEDRLIANESKDPNKVNVFLKGIDGHCLNAYGYFKDEFLARGIVIDDLSDPKKVNEIKKLAPDLRQKGKPYTFGFSYGAAPEKYGQELYNAYWETYAGVKVYNDKKIAEAREKGYIISTFSGLRLKVPKINARLEYDRAKEERVVCNFSIQSGNFLMLEAISIIYDYIRDNNLYGSVEVINTVHDSVYLNIAEDYKLIEDMNKVIVNAMCDNYNKTNTNASVKLEAELDIGYEMIKLETIPNDADVEKIKETLEELKEN